MRSSLLAVAETAGAYGATMQELMCHGVDERIRLSKSMVTNDSGSRLGRRIASPARSTEKHLRRRLPHSSSIDGVTR
jgi:hypothetical protein